MFAYAFPIVLIVSSNIFYNICQKSTPENVNPMAALLVSYLTAAMITLAALPFYRSDKGVMESFAQLNWTSVGLGLSVVGLELGYIMAYRAGWNISVVTLVANIFLALALIPVGVWLYKEGFAPHKLIGVALCVAGLLMLRNR